MASITSSPTPWHPGTLVEQVQTLATLVPIDQQTPASSAEAILDGACFHLDFLDHHLQHALFPAENHGENPPAPFAANPSRRFLSVLTASARPDHSSSIGRGGAALHNSPVQQPGGKPVMNQSALHGFHVFEGLQLVAERLESGGYRFGYTFLREKVAKLVDGIIRLRFAVHMLKASVLIRHLQNRNHSAASDLQARFSQAVNHDLPYRRSQAEEFVTQALLHFAEDNRAEMTTTVDRNPEACFYVRVEAQGGNRESIGQGPIGVGQSTLQILGQHAQRPDTPAMVVMNPDAPPRMHSLAGPFTGSPLYTLLNNNAVHHGNMGHQHLSSEMAQPHGSDMLMSTAEIDEDGRVQGPFIAETNFSNIGFVYGEHLFFPKSNSATYGLIQHVIRQALGDAMEKGRDLVGITGFEHEPLTLERFMTGLREGKLTGAFVMGSMPGIRPVSAIYLDETLSGGSITSYAMNHESPALKTLCSLFDEAYYRHIVWKQGALGHASPK